MRRTVITKYLAPTDRKGARIKASTPGGTISVVVPYDHSKSGYWAHAVAVEALENKVSGGDHERRNWTVGDWARGYVFVRGDDTVDA